MPRAGQRLTSPQGNQGFPHSVQSPRLPVNQVRVQGVPHLQLLQTTTWIPVGHQAVDIKLIVGHEMSLLPAANDQALQAQWPAAIPFHSQATENGEVLSSESDSSQGEGVGTEEEDNSRKVRAGSRPQVMSRRLLMVKISRSALTPRTPSPGLVSYSVSMRTPTLSLTLERKSRQHGEGSASTVPRRTAPQKNSSRSSSSEEELPTDEVLQDGARQKVRLLDTRFDAWHHDKIANNVTGWAT